MVIGNGDLVSVFNQITNSSESLKQPLHFSEDPLRNPPTDQNHQVNRLTNPGQMIPDPQKEFFRQW